MSRRGYYSPDPERGGKLDRTYGRNLGQRKALTRKPRSREIGGDVRLTERFGTRSWKAGTCLMQTINKKYKRRGRSGKPQKSQGEPGQTGVSEPNRREVAGGS